MIKIDFSKIAYDSREFVTFLRNSQHHRKIRRIINKLSKKDQLLLRLRVLDKDVKSYKELKTVFNVAGFLLRQRVRTCLRKIHRILLNENIPTMKLSELTNKEKIKESIFNILANSQHPYVLFANVRFTKLVGFSFIDFMAEIDLNAFELEDYGHIKKLFMWFRGCLFFMRDMPAQEMKEKYNKPEVLFGLELPKRSINALQLVGIYSRAGLKYYPIEELKKIPGVGRTIRKKLVELIKTPYHLKKYEELVRDHKMITPFWYEVNFVLQKYRKNKAITP